MGGIIKACWHSFAILQLLFLDTIFEVRHQSREEKTVSVNLLLFCCFFIRGSQSEFVLLTGATIHGFRSFVDNCDNGIGK